MDVVWLDVSMRMGLTSNYHPLTNVECDAPDPLPTDTGQWQQWAIAYLSTVAAYDGWRPGDYAYSAEHRDPSGRTLEVFVRGQWQLTSA